MPATRSAAVSTIPALDDYVHDCLARQLAMRDGLPHAANGRPIAPSDAYAAKVTKDMQQARSQEYKRLLVTWITNIRDGVPLPIVRQPLNYLAAVLDTEAREYRPRSLVALTRAETRAQSMLDLAQFRTVQNENDVEALEQMSGEIAAHRARLDELGWETDRRIAYLRGGQPAARPTLVRLK